MSPVAPVLMTGMLHVLAGLGQDTQTGATGTVGGAGVQAIDLYIARAEVSQVYMAGSAKDEVFPN